MRSARSVARAQFRPWNYRFIKQQRNGDVGDVKVVPDLIYDVGVNDGADSAYYLSRGFKVVGIEASPVMSEALRKRFQKEIAEQRYTLLNVGVASSDGSAEFWMSDVSDWSSFDKRVASRNGTPHRSVLIETREFSTIIEQYGVPFYCKIDIEGNDRFCLSGLTTQTAPPYISIEMSHRDAGTDLDTLADLDYRSFKIVSQVTRSQPIPWLVLVSGRLPQFPRRVMNFAIKRTIGALFVNGWKFLPGSSGPFAEDTPGNWQSLDQVKRRWSALKEIDEREGTRGLGDWFDIHAKL
jgi:FkbM family methyltransferase